MTLQYSVAVRNAGLDARETAIGVSAVLKIRNGAAPANCAAADSGTVLASCTLPSDWMAAASSGSKALAGTWSGTGAAAAGGGTNAGHFRILDSGAAAVHMQGTITATGGGGDLTLNNISIADGQAVAITTFTVAAANA